MDLGGVGLLKSMLHLLLRGDSVVRGGSLSLVVRKGTFCGPRRPMHHFVDGHAAEVVYRGGVVELLAHPRHFSVLIGHIVFVSLHENVEIGLGQVQVSTFVLRWQCMIHLMMLVLFF